MIYTYRNIDIKHTHMYNIYNFSIYIHTYTYIYIMRINILNFIILLIFNENKHILLNMAYRINH